MDTKEYCIIVDIDGTLGEPYPERMKCVKPENYIDPDADWHGFYKDCDRDTVKDEIKELVNVMGHDVVIVLLTSRNERARKLTEKWLEENNIFYDILLMRPDDNFTTPDYELKWSMYKKYIQPYYNTYFILDDKMATIKIFRDNGIAGLYCGPPIEVI